jgi:hypothetical protein
MPQGYTIISNPYCGIQHFFLSQNFPVILQKGKKKKGKETKMTCKTTELVLKWY